MRFIVTLAVVLSVSLTASLAQPPGKPDGKGPGPRPGPPPFPVMEALDTNHDGELSAEEISRAPQVLRKLDKNHDGKLSREELRPRGFGPGGPWGAPGDSRGPIKFTSTPLPQGDGEKKILGVLAAMAGDFSPDAANVPPQDGRILRLLAETIGARHVVELGTSTGYSGVWFCLALRHLKGKLTTFEIDAGRAARARANFQRAGVSALVTLVEGDAHEKVKALKDPIDLLFLDADKPGYLDYLNKLLPLVRPGGLVIAHNMNQHQADPRYVKAITTRPELETVFLNMERSGIAVTLKKR